MTRIPLSDFLGGGAAVAPTPKRMKLEDFLAGGDPAPLAASTPVPLSVPFVNQPTIDPLGDMLRAAAPAPPVQGMPEVQGVLDNWNLSGYTDPELKNPPSFELPKSALTPTAISDFNERKRAEEAKAAQQRMDDLLFAFNGPNSGDPYKEGDKRLDHRYRNELVNEYYGGLPYPMTGDVLAARLDPSTKHVYDRFRRLNELATGNLLLDEPQSTTQEDRDYRQKMIDNERAMMQARGLDPAQYLAELESFDGQQGFFGRNAAAMGNAASDVARNIYDLATDTGGGQNVQGTRMRQQDAAWRETIEDVKDERSALPNWANEVARSSAQATPQLAGAAVVGAATRNPALATATMLGPAALDTYQTGRANGMSEGAAVGRALALAGVEYATMKAGGAIAGTFGGRTFEEVAFGTGAKSTQRGLLGTLAEKAGSGATEGGEEVAAAIAQQVGDHLIGLEDELIGDETPEQLALAFAVGFVASGAMHGINSFSEFVQNPTKQNAEAAGITEELAPTQADRESLAAAAAEKMVAEPVAGGLPGQVADISPEVAPNGENTQNQVADRLPDSVAEQLPPPAEPAPKKSIGRRIEPVSEDAPVEPQKRSIGKRKTVPSITTLTGREIPAPPQITGGGGRKTANQVRSQLQWLLDQGIAEAEARGDDFNLSWMRNEKVGSLTKGNGLPQATVDSLNEYLFGETNPSWDSQTGARIESGQELSSPPPVIPPVTKPLVPPPKHEATQTIAGKMTLDEFEQKGYQPDEVTREDWVNMQRSHRRSIGQSEESGTKYAPFADYEEYHKQAVEDALKKGDEVDERVLADYPDLAKKYTPSPSVAPPDAPPVAPSQAPADSGVAKETGYLNGDQIEYTGVITDDGMREFVYLEGAKKGQTGVRWTEAEKNARSEQNQRDWQEQQEGFKRLREASDQIVDANKMVPDVSRLQESSVQAQKQADGTYKLAYTGTSNEVFPGERFTSAWEARNYFKATRQKQRNAAASQTPAPPAQVEAVAPKKSIGKKRELPPVLKAAEFKQKLRDAATTQEEGDNLYRIVEARADAAGESVDEYVGKRIADIMKADRVDSEYLKQLASGKGDALAQAAYHGSPYKFDKFTTDKIGTGEGAQAYGWGLYFAGNKEVAKYYKEALSANRNLGVPRSRPVGQPPSAAEMRATKDVNAAFTRSLSVRGISNPKTFSDLIDFYNFRQQAASLDAKHYEENKDSIDSEIKAWKDQIRAKNPQFTDKQIEDALETIGAGMVRHPYQSAYDSALNELSKHSGGALYKVDLKPSEDEYLDWDKPLDQQSEKVKAALQASGFEIKSNSYPSLKQAENLFRSQRVQDDARSDIGIRESLKAGWKLVQQGDDAGFREWFDKHGGLLSPGRHRAITGEDAYRKLGIRLINESGSSVPFSDNQKLATQALNALGIRGIRYLDGNSRSKGEGHHNYVIFDGADAVIEEVLAQKNGKTPKPNAEIQFLAEDGRAIIRAFREGQNLSSLLHELLHVFELDLTDDQRARLDGWLNSGKWTYNGAKPGKTKDGKWNRAAREKFARAGERYFREGKAPTPELEGVFAKFKQWLSTVYKTIKGSPIDVEMSPEFRAVMDELFGKKVEVATETKRQTRPVADAIPSDVQVEVEAIKRKTGERVKVKQNAKEAYQELESDAALYKQLLNCLGK